MKDSLRSITWKNSGSLFYFLRRWASWKTLKAHKGRYPLLLIQTPDVSLRKEVPKNTLFLEINFLNYKITLNEKLNLFYNHKSFWRAQKQINVFLGKKVNELKQRSVAFSATGRKKIIFNMYSIFPKITQKLLKNENVMGKTFGKIH